MTTEYYAEALEQQLATLRWTARQRDFRMVGGKSRENPTGKTDPDGITAEEIQVRALEYGDPYFWARNTCDLVAVASETLTEWAPAREDFHTDAGFFWYAKPLYLPIADDENGPEFAPDDLCAFSWCRYTQPKDDPEPPDIPDGIVVQAWHRTPVRMTGTPGAMLAWPYGSLLSHEIYRLNDRSDILDLTPGVRLRQAMILRYFAASIIFTNQVLEVRSTGLDRQSQKRLGRTGLWQRPEEPAVRVVRFRRTRSSAARGESEQQEWSCHWAVRGHWRQQWYPSRQAYAPKWIMPYVKGDTTKPLKRPATAVFAVVR